MSKRYFQKTRGHFDNKQYLGIAGGGGDMFRANNLSDVLNVTTARTNLGLGTIATLNDLSSRLANGSGISINTVSGVSTISATGGGGGGSVVPHGYYGAFENTISPSQSASTNVTNLNTLLGNMNAAGGGLLWFNDPGPIQINSTITLQSYCGIRMVPGAYFEWVGGSTGPIFQSPNTQCLVLGDYDILVNEGTSFTGTIFDQHSGEENRLLFRAFGANASSTFVSIQADSTAGQPSFSYLNSGRNFALNTCQFRHYGYCGTGLTYAGITSGYGGAAQGVTDNTFHGCSFANVNNRGIKIDQWADTNTFSGNTYIGLVGYGGIGLSVNESHVNNYTVYNHHWEHLAVDTFNTGLNRYGVLLNESKMMFCDEYFNDPQAENGAFVATNCLSYYWRMCNPGTNNIIDHYKGWSQVTP